MSGLVDVGSLTTCAICFDTFNLPVRLGCDHIFCRQCWGEARKHKPDCPMCRKPHVGDGTPDAVMMRLVSGIPRHQPCGSLVTKGNLEKHEQDCGVCASITKKELKSMVYKLVRRVMQVEKGRKQAIRSEKRARDESDRHHENSLKFQKTLRDRDRRTHRYILREANCM